MSEQDNAKKPHNRRYPPYVLKVEETEHTALFVDIDGSVYRKYYDPEYGGGAGRRRIRLGAPLVLLRPSVRQAIADAWTAQDQAHDRINQRRELALASADTILRDAGLTMTAEELCSQAGQIAGYELPDGTQLLLRTSPDDSVTPQWRHTDVTSDPIDLTPDRAAELLRQAQETPVAAKAPVRTNTPTRRFGHGTETPGMET